MIPIPSGYPLFNGVSELYFNNGNSVSVYGNDPEAQVIVSLGDDGLFGVYNGDGHEPPLLNPNAVPEPASLVLIAAGLAGLVLRRRRVH